MVGGGVDKGLYTEGIDNVTTHVIADYYPIGVVIRIIGVCKSQDEPLVSYRRGCSDKGW